MITTSISRALHTIVLTLFLGAASFAQIVITEISYNPPESGTDSLEFIELYNNGASAVNLSGYNFTQGVTFTFPSMMLAAGQYVTVCEDSVAMQIVFGTAAHEWTSGALTNGGEDIILVDNFGATVDSVDYDNAGPWPVGPPSPDGDGPSIVLCDPSADNSLGSNWSVSLDSAVGQVINGFQVFGSPNSAATCPIAVGPEVVTVEVVDNSTLAIVFDNWVQSPSATTGTNYVATPALTYSSLNLGTTQDSVILNLAAPLVNGANYQLIIDNVLDTAGTPMNQPDTVHFIFNDGFPALIFTEIMYNNPGVDDYEFLEIYNDEGTAVELGGFSLTGVDFVFPPMTLGAGQTVLLAQDAALCNSFFGATFLQWDNGSLNNTAEYISINNTLGQVIDSLTYGDTSPWPAAADGSGPSLELIDIAFDNALGGSWQASITYVDTIPGADSIWATPGSLITVVQPILTFQIQNMTVNEDTGTVEIIVLKVGNNPLPSSVDVFQSPFSSATIIDDFLFSVNPTTINFPAGGSSSDTITITIIDDNDVEGSEDINILLQNPVNASLAGISNHVIIITDNDTAPVVINNPAAVFINEIMSANTVTVADPQGEFDDWIEIFNDNDTAVNLAGLYISNNAANPTMYQFPTGGPSTIIPANDFVLIWADLEQSVNGPLHVNFDLDATTSGFVGLYASDGTSQIDTVTYPALGDDVSYGRSGDGVAVWQQFSPTTPGNSNIVIGLTDRTSSKESLIIFPNPAKDNFVWVNKMGNYDVINLLGQKVISVKSTNRIQLDGLTSGVYLVKADSGAVARLVVK